MQNVTIYKIGNGQFLMDDEGLDYSALGRMGAAVAASGSSGGMLAMASSGPPDPGSGGSTNSPPPVQITNGPLNFVKFKSQCFTVVNTNLASIEMPSLYTAVLSFPPNTAVMPNLQIMQFATNGVLIKANGFDYSAETRNFALIIVDDAGRPTWKSIDLAGPSDAQDGWVVQGMVPPYAVTDPMYLLVTNLNPAWNGFFRAIPYSGPQVAISGVQPYQTVSGQTAMHAAVTDLSGLVSSSLAFSVTVNGLAARYTLGAGNTVTLDTRYAASGDQEVEFNLGCLPVVFDPQNPPMDTQLEFGATAAVTLDFENHAFVVNASDMCSPDIGTNIILFGFNQPDSFQATISASTGGRVLAQYSGSVSGAGAVGLLWNFTEANGLTPYTNDTYVVSFTATDPEQLNITNKIDRYGVRAGGGVVMSYVEETDTNDPNTAWLNSEADTWIAQTLRYTIGQYPDLQTYQPVVAGCYWLPFTIMYDDQIMGNDFSNIQQ